MSLVQSRCSLQTRLSPASFAGPIWTRNEQQIQRHQAPEFPFSSWYQQQSFKSLLTHCGVQIRLQQEKPRWVGLNGRMVSIDTRLAPGLWAVAMLCVAVIHCRSLTLTALTRLVGSGLPHTSVLCFYPSPFFENSSDLHQSQDWPWRQLGAITPICPLPVTTLMSSSHK